MEDLTDFCWVLALLGNEFLKPTFCHLSLRLGGPVGARVTRTVQALGHLMSWCGSSFEVPDCLLWILPDRANSGPRMPSGVSNPKFRPFLSTVLQPSGTPACSYLTVSTTSCHVNSAENTKPSGRSTCEVDVYVGRLDACRPREKKRAFYIDFRQSFSSIAKQARDLNEIVLRGRGRDGPPTTQLSGGFDQFW